MEYIIVILLSYLVGSSNMAKYLAMAKKVDLTAGGSGNLGASNAVILMGWGAGILTAIHDIGKAALAVILILLIILLIAVSVRRAGRSRHSYSGGGRRSSRSYRGRRR